MRLRWQPGAAGAATQQRPGCRAAAARVPPHVQQQRRQCRHPRSIVVFVASAVPAAAAAPAQPAEPAAAPGSSGSSGSSPAAPAAPSGAPADPCLELSGVEARGAGALLGAMCGNALGVQLEPEKHYRVTRLFPDGVCDMAWSFDVSAAALPPGHVNGDFVTGLAVAKSLLACRGAQPAHIVDWLATCYNPEGRVHYSPYTQLVVEGLATGTNPYLLAHHAESYAAMTPSRASQTASHRPDRQLHGTTDFTAVIRGLPIGLAYREATAQVLRKAVEAAVLFSHPTEQGCEGAVAIAAAVAWLARADPATASPDALLDHLLSSVSGSSPDMSAKLQLLRHRLPGLTGLGRIDSWRAFWRSKAWSDITATACLLSKQNLAMQGTQAAALALWVQCVSWAHPQQAVMLAASLGGYAGTTAALVGGLAGALHGCAWVPAAWWQQLQDPEAVLAAAVLGGDGAGEADEGEAAAAAEPEAAQEDEEEVAEALDDANVLLVGRRSVVELGQALARLDCRALAGAL